VDDVNHDQSAVDDVNHDQSAVDEKKIKKKLLTSSASEDSDGGGDEDSRQKEKGNIRQRLFSKSDTTFDIRPFIKNRSFLLCRCFVYEEEEDYNGCECDGRICVNEDLSGSVGSTFFNPLVTEEEQEVDVGPRFTKSTWSKARPNEMKLTFKSAADPSVKSVTGQILVSAERSVERVKGRKLISIFLTGVFNLSITLNKASTRKPIKFREIKFDLVESVEPESSLPDGEKGVAHNEALNADSSGVEE